MGQACKKNGFEGIYFVSVNDYNASNPYIKAVIQYGYGTFRDACLYKNIRSYSIVMSL